MSGDQLVARLEQLRYRSTQAHRTDGRSLDWMFEDSATAPFLKWFCRSIQERNVVDHSEFLEFEQLSREGDCILDGHHLEDALQNLSISEESSTNEAKLSEEVADLQNDLKIENQKKHILVQQSKMLRMVDTSLSEKNVKMEKVLENINRKYKPNLEQVQTLNAKMNASLLRVAHTVNKLTKLYQDTSDTSSQKISAFLSQVSLAEFYRDEEKFTQQLHAYTKKQFFGKIAEMTRGSPGTRYDFLEVSNPVDLLVRGEKEDVNMDDCKGLARLQAIYPTSECQRINSVVEKSSTQAALACAESKLRTSKKEKLHSMDVGNLSNKLQDCRTKLSVTRRDVDHLTQKELPVLIRDSSVQQLAKILRGDYDLKISRQDYFISNQDQLIRQLILQRSRNEFLTMAYEIELKGHRNMHRLLTSAAMLLKDNLARHTERLKMMVDSGLTSKRHSRETIDSRDKSTSRLYKLLDVDAEHDKQLFYTFSGLLENSEKHRKHMDSLRSSLSSSRSNRNDKLTVLESNLRTCESLVYSRSGTSGELSLSPQAIVDTLTQLNAMLKKLEQAVMDVIKDTDHKKKVLKTDPLAQTERELFIYFLTDPDNLRKAINVIASQVQAQLVR